MNETETAQHTPGPWCLEGHGIYHRQARGRVHVGYCTHLPKKLSIADLPSESPRYDEAGANARLIAAAPELLEALKGVLDIMAYYHKAALPENANHADVCDMPDNCGHCKAILAARAAMDRVIGNDPNARVPKPNRDTCVGCPAETLHCHETCSTAIVERERIRAAIAKATKETP